MDAKMKKLVAGLLALLLEDDDTPSAPEVTKAAPKATKATPKPLRSMNAHAEAPTAVATKVHEAFPMAEGVLEFDTVGNVHIVTGIKSCLMVDAGDHFDRTHQYGAYQMKIWSYGPINTTFSWPQFLKVFGDSSRWQSVAIDADRGGLQEIPDNSKDDHLLSQYLEEEGDQNKFRINWRRLTK